MLPRDIADGWSMAPRHQGDNSPTLDSRTNAGMDGQVSKGATPDGSAPLRLAT